MIKSWRGCHLTLAYDGVPLEELLHHHLLTLTGNLQTHTTLTGSHHFKTI